MIKEPGSSTPRPARVDFTERCIRAHASLAEATELNRRIEGFYRGSRILDNDAFGLAFAR